MNSVLPSKSIQIGSNISINVSTSFGFLDPISGNIDLSAGLNISGTMRFTDDFSMTFGGHLGSNSSFTGGASFGEWSVYGTSFSGSYSQVVCGIGYHALKNGWRFNLENDMFGDGGDRYRSSALEIGNGKWAVGTQVFTSEPGEATGKGDNDAKSRWGPNEDGTYNDAKVYRSPLYVSYQNNRIGINDGRVQDWTQNFIHNVFGAIPYIGFGKAAYFPVPEYRNEFYYEKFNRRPGSLYSY